MMKRWPHKWQFIWNSKISDEKYIPHCFFSALYRTPRAMCSPHPSHHTFTGISKRTITMPWPSFLARLPSGWCYQMRGRRVKLYVVELVLVSLRGVPVGRIVVAIGLYGSQR